MSKSILPSDVKVVDLALQSHPLRVFYEDSQVIILAFHDGFESLASLFSLITFEKKVLIILSCSWYVSESRAGIFKGYLKKALDIKNPAITKNSFLIVANSNIEFSILQKTLDEISVVHANNSSFIDHNEMNIDLSISKVYDAVLNAKVNKFKRHFLSMEVENKVFVSYRTSETSGDLTKESDLEKLKPVTIFWNLTPAEVAKTLNKCQVGMMLSAEEGACYASLEYLLCGLPVVSTASRGGRDDFYESRTAILVDDSPSAVRKGVEACIEKIVKGQFDSAEIRYLSLEKVYKFRRNLSEAISSAISNLQCSLPCIDIVESNLMMGSKFSKTRNFWAKEFLRLSDF